MPDQGHLGLRMPPPYSGGNPVGWLTGQAAIRMHRECLGRARQLTGLPGWARGEGVSPVGLDEPGIRAYLRHPAQEEKRQEALPRKGLEPLSEET